MLTMLTKTTKKLPKELAPFKAFENGLYNHILRKSHKLNK